MKHKGILSLIGVVLISGMLIAGSAAAEEASDSGLEWKVGVGYQGMWVGGFLNGISARACIEEKYGVEAN
jgi:cobalamin biosynthesis Co2+ chelatase CbiK